MTPPPYIRLVVSGGALPALGFLGCLQRLEELHLAHDATHLIGTSAGSILCFFKALGYSAAATAAFFVAHGPALLNTFSVDNVFNLLGAGGACGGDAAAAAACPALSDGRNLDAFLRLALRRSPLRTEAITFLDFAKRTGVHLVVCVSDLVAARAAYWSVDTVPDLDVVTAVRASCALPLLFAPVAYRDGLYADGALFANTPAVTAEALVPPRGGLACGPVAGNTLVLRLATTLLTPAPRVPTLRTFWDYAQLLLRALLAKTNEATGTPEALPPHVHVWTVEPLAAGADADPLHSGFSFVDFCFDLSHQNVWAHVQHGYAQAVALEQAQAQAPHAAPAVAPPNTPADSANASTRSAD